MTAIPGSRDDDRRFVPPVPDDEPYSGIREGDDGHFLFAIWTLAKDWAEEAVGTLDACSIADKITDAVAVARRKDRTFLDDEGARRAYVLRAVVNATKNVHKAAKVRVKLHARFAPLIETSTMSRAFPAPDARELATLREEERSQMMDHVWREVAALPSKCHAVVYYTYVEDLWPREVAKKLAIKVDTVHSHLKRAHKRIREAVRQYLIERMRETNT